MTLTGAKLGSLESNVLTFLWKSGAGEGIRTLDPNLGKVFRHFTPAPLFLSQRQLSPYRAIVFLVARNPDPILLLPRGFRSRASPLLPRASPPDPGKQNSEFSL